MNRRQPFFAPPGPYSWDRLLTFGVILLVTIPLVVYALIALNADRDTRVDTAQAHNLGTAQLVSSVLDGQCDSAISALAGTGSAEMAAALRSRSATGAARHLQSLRTADHDLDLVAAYDSQGSVITEWRAPGAGPRVPVAHRGWAKLFAREQRRYAVQVVRSAAGTAILLAVPVRDGKGLAGFLVAGIEGRRVDDWLLTVPLASSIVYVADPTGHVVAGTCSTVMRQLPLDEYEPMRYALHSQKGVMVIQSPDSVDDHLVGYAPTKVSGCGVVVTQPMDAAFQATNFLALRLSALLLPIIVLAGNTAWHRLRSARQVEQMAGRLAEQNEGLRAADRAKSEFLAQVSHDLRTPLAAMHISLSDLLEPDVKWSKEKVRDALSTVSLEVEQLTARVQGLLEMARLEAGMRGAAFELRDLTDVVAGALEKMEPLLRGRAIDELFPDEPLLVECDQGELEKVVVNLLENATKYSPAGTAIHIRGERRDGDRPEARFAVWDEGAGLSPGDEERVFEKFFRAERTRSVRGTGLGLSICRAIIERHGGRLGARNHVSNAASEPNGAAAGGAEFYFSLPLASLDGGGIGRETPAG